VSTRARVKRNSRAFQQDPTTRLNSLTERNNNVRLECRAILRLWRELEIRQVSPDAITPIEPQSEPSRLCKNKKNKIKVPAFVFPLEEKQPKINAIIKLIIE
jgi:hypothetical protein